MRPAAVLALGAFFSLLCSCGDPESFDVLEIRPSVDARAPDTSIEVDAVLAKLDRHLANVGEVTNPPATEAAIDAVEKQLPCKFPALMRQMYLWHDGATKLVPGYEWLSLQDLVAEYEAFRKLESDLDLLPGEAIPLSFLPMLRFDGEEHISVDCSAPDHAPLFHTFSEDDSRDPRYRGIGHLLAVTSTAFESGAYSRRRGYLDADPTSTYEVIKQYALPAEVELMEANWQDLQAKLRTADGMGFEYATSLILHVPDARSVPLLVDRLDDEDADVVARAAFALGQLRADEAAPELTRLLVHESDTVRNLAASAISELDVSGLDNTIDNLLGLLGDRSELVVISAIEALGNARARAAVDPLIERLRASRPGIQQYVVRALGDIGDPKALPALRELQSELSSQDVIRPDRGGTRGSDPSPSRLKANVDDAISRLGG